MDKEKIVVILLLLTIILSIGSIIFTFSMNFDLDDMQTPQRIQSSSSPTNQGGVKLTVKAPEGGAP